MASKAPYSRAFGRLHRRLGRSPLGTWLAIKLRNQASRVIGEHLSDGPDMHVNGEALLVRSLGRISTFVDVGANVGDWSAYVLEHAGGAARGVLFDPSTLAMQRLHARFDGIANLELVEAALADEAGTATFHEEPEAGGTSSLVRGQSLPSAETRVVRVSTLDAEMESRGWDSIDALKIDAEGYDLRVIKGAKSLLSGQRVGVLQFEYNKAWAGAGSTLADALRVLEGHGYSVYLLRRQGLYGFSYERYFEFFEYSNFVAISSARARSLQSLVVGTI